MTSNFRFQLSSISLQHQFTTQRQWRKFLMNQVLTMCLTVDTMHSRNFSKYIYMNRSLLCEPRRICNANAVNGGAGCQRIYWQMLRLNSLNTIHSGSIQRDSYDEEQDREFAFLTNAFHLTAPEIANLYKNRWQIELFFKWLKQHLKIKKFWGTTENAVRIQISSAIIAYCLVAIVQHDLQLKRSTYEVLQILSISLMDKTPLVDLFERTDFNNVKELDCPLFPGLFD